MLIAGLIVLHALVTLVAACHVVLQDKRPAVQLGWIFGIAAVPVLGLAGYLLLGSDRLLLRRERRRQAYRPLREAAFTPASNPGADELKGRWEPTFSALSSLSEAEPTGGNAFEVLANAEAFYPRLEEAIDQARGQLWLCFYVWRDDEVGRDFLRRLTAAAERGVEVRLLVDEVGSGPTPESLFDDLIAAGGRFSWTTTLFPRRNRWFLNLRNHRKIVVADGHLAFTGGMNIGCEYRDGIDGSEWNDLQLAVRGPAVTQLAAVFADDWHFATGERLEPMAIAEPVTDGTVAQLIAGGPDHQPATTARSIEAVIHSAQRELVLTTPYFVPDEGLLGALELAAASGVTVRLLVSAETDMGPLLLLSRSYFERLLTAGVEICEYAADIHHAKLILVDGELAVVGSINLDIRSFHLNYEIALAIPDPALVSRLEAYIGSRCEDAETLQLERFAKRPMPQRLREGALRLLAPLL